MVAQTIEWENSALSCRDEDGNHWQRCAGARRSFRALTGIIVLVALFVSTSTLSLAQNLINSGATINNSGTIRVKDQAIGLPPAVDGVFEYFGTNQNIPATQYKNLTLSGSGMKTTVGGSFSVSQNLTVAAPVTLKVQSGSSITLIGDLIENGYLEGSIRKTEDLSGATTSSNFGNIGATLSWTIAPPGTTTVNRVSGVASTGNGNQSILRYYDIAPTFNSNLNVSMVFRYSDTELNGRDPNTLELWRSIDGGVTWRRQGGTVNTLTRTITKSGIKSLSRWTASDAAHPLGPLDYEWVAKNLVITSGNGASGVVNSTLPPFVVTITDAYGNPIQGVAVTFVIASTPAGATGQNLSTTNATTDASGQASTSLTLGNVAGTYTVSASSAGLVGSPVTFTATATSTPPPPPPPPPAATTIVQISGNNQSGRILTALSNPFVVRVTNSSGTGVANVAVTFALVDSPATATGQALSVSSALTNSNGEASTVLTLGNKVGTYRVTASSTGLTGSPITFSATATNGPPASLAMKSGDGQSGIVRTSLPNPLIVTVLDAGANPVPNDTVLWSITAVPSGAQGQSLSLVLSVTDSSGSALNMLTLGSLAGEYRVTAQSARLPGSVVTFRAFARSGAPAQLLLTSGDGQSGIVRSRLANPFVVTVRDSLNNPVAGVSVNWSVAQKPNNAGGEELQIQNAVTDSLGRSSAIFTLGDKVGQYMVKAGVNGIRDSVVTFVATARAGAARLLVLISGDGQTAPARTKLPAPFIVTVTDSLSNPVSGVNVSWAIDQVPNGAVGQVLTDIVSTTDSAGRASAILTLGDKAGDYLVKATSAGLSGSPITFRATATQPQAVAMQMMSGDGQRAPVTTGLPAPLVVFVRDAAGLPVSGVTVRWRISSTPAGALGQALTDTITVTSDSGRAATGLKLGDKTGIYTVEATSAGLAGSPVIFTAEATPGTARAPVAIVLTSGNSQSTTINTTLPSPFVVQVIDIANRPVSGVPVSFTIDANSLPTGALGQSISTTYALTDSTGRASTTLTLGNKVGVYSVLATSPGLTNSPIIFTALATPGQPASLIAVRGDGQTRRVGLQLQEPFVLGVYDQGGNPVPGRQVQFTISSVPVGATGQSISTSGALTNNLGQASTILTLGNQPGEYIVTAAVVGYSGTPVNFRATAQPLGASAIAQASGNLQVGLIRSTLPVPLTVRVVDQIGNPVEDVTVTFTFATLPSGTVGHRLSATTVQTDSSGQASTTLTLGTKVGVYIVHASSPGLSGSPVVFTATALPGAALLQTSGDGQSGRVLAKLRNPFVATVLDATGTPVPGVKVIWEVKSRPVGATGYQLDSLSTVTNDSGRVVNFLTLGNRVGQYTVTATSAGLSGSPLTFTATAVTGSAPATMLLTSGNNQTGYVSTSLAAPFVVTVLDSASRPVERVNVNFMIDTDNLPAGAVGQTLSANFVPTDSNGRAGAVLTLGNKAGVYRVFASVPGVANSPIIFQATATPVPSAALVYLSGSNQTGRVRTTLPNPFTVLVFDAQGNPVQGTQVTFAIDSLPTGSVGHALSTTVATTNTLGLASTTLTFGQKSGRYVVRAESPGLANSPLRFLAHALPEAPTVVAVASGNNQAKSIREALDSALVVRVADPNDNPVPGIIVNFAITEAPSGSIGHRLSSASGITDERGLASTRLTLGDKLGVYRVTATATGVGSVVFTARTEVMIADVNGDREVNIADMTMIIDHILGRIALTGIDSVRADVNSDGSIDVADVIHLRRFLLAEITSLSKSSYHEPTFGRLTVPTSSAIRGEFEATKYGIRFNLQNDVPVKGFQLVVRFKNVVPAAAGQVSLVFTRAKMMQMPANASGREIRVVAYNDDNTPIESGRGAIFRFAQELLNLNDIESSELIVSTGEGIHQALMGTVTTIQQTQLPVSFKLEQNYPNPFNPSTTIEFEVPDDPSGFINVALVIYNQLGQRVKTLVDGELEAGRYKWVWNGTDDSGMRVSSGMYYYRLLSRDYQSAKRMILLR